MRRSGGLALAGVALLAFGAVAQAEPPHRRHRSHRARRAPAVAPPPTFGPVSGPAAEYWMSAATTSGLEAAAAPGVAPSRGPEAAAPSMQHTLTLQLGSTAAAIGAPEATDIVPSGLGMGPSLRLVTPPPGEAAPPEGFARPTGKLLVFWGCGEHVGPGQPVLLDFAGATPPSLAGAVSAQVERAPSAKGAVTYGRWPGDRRAGATPATGSLVGPHEVRGDYAPDIRFDVARDVDFMAPLDLALAGATAQGGKRLVWRPAANVTGYHLMLVGAQGRHKDAAKPGTPLVFWSSSAVRPGVFDEGLGDYLTPRETARLIAARAVLPPAAHECVVPSEVAHAAPRSVVNAIGYGPEREWTDPPRPDSGPWEISWRAKLRLKTTAALALGPVSDRAGLPPPSKDHTREVLDSLRPF